MKKYNKFETARLIGARALQISMGAPILVKHEGIYNPIEIAKKEFQEDVFPITIRRLAVRGVVHEGNTVQG